MGHIVALTGERALPDKLCPGHAFRDDAIHFKTIVLDNFSAVRRGQDDRPAWAGKALSHDAKVARRAPAS
jgi:hypothetical protein